MRSACLSSYSFTGSFRSPSQRTICPLIFVTNMRRWSTVVLAGSVTLLHVHGWTAPTGTTTKFISHRMNRVDAKKKSKMMPWSSLSSTSSIPLSLRPLQLSVVALEAQPVSTSPFFDLNGEVIAEGTVLSVFPGGLVSVRVDEDATSEPSSPGPSTNSTGTASGDLMGRHVWLTDGRPGVVVAHRPPIAFVYTTAASSSLAEEKGNLVKIGKSLASITSISDHCRVVDCFGRPLMKNEHSSDGDKTMSRTGMERPIFAPTPQVKDIALINNPTLTGITIIDALASIGQGQNMLMVGHDIESMRGYALDFLRTQALYGRNTKLVYASTVEDSREVLRRFQAAGIADQVHLVSKVPDSSDHDDSSRAAESVTIAGTACAIGEAYAWEQGKNAIVVVDTIDMHKQLWDATTRQLVELYGVDAVVEGERSGGASSEMRAFYSYLVQRSCQLKTSRGGGSVTLLLMTTIPKSTESSSENTFQESDFEQMPDKLQQRIKVLIQRKIPLTAENLKKINIPVPSISEGERRLALQQVDDLHSMTDGLIWLDEDLEKQRRIPPLDPQKSVTRIGIGADTVSRADAPALRRVAEGLRLNLAQAFDIQTNTKDSASERQRIRAGALLLAMFQEPGKGGRRLSESCAALLAAQEGYLDECIRKGSVAGTERGTKIMQGLFAHLFSKVSDSMADIDKEMDLSDDTRKRVTDAIASFFA